MDNVGANAKLPVPSANYHLLLACNMACSHCFANRLSAKRLPVEGAAGVVRLIADAGCEKINFAGGEPMLHPGLDLLIRTAKECGMTTSIVTNGAKITDPWLDEISGYLDWVALSIDSPCQETHTISGRVDRNDPISPERYLEMCRSIRERGIRLKINTVVTIHNHMETMANFVSDAWPERWKIMRALLVSGQNDRKPGPFEVTSAQFDAYVKRNIPAGGIAVVSEDNDMMTGSYLMIDPMGRFYDNVDGHYRYGRPIPQVGVEMALQDIRVDRKTFERRGGLYDWQAGPLGPVMTAPIQPDATDKSEEST